MQVHLNLSKLEHPARLRKELDDMVRRSFAKFADMIVAVQLTVTDINGPKGGIDKHCRAVISLRGLQPIVIDDMDAKSSRVARRVLSRASASLRQRINRRSRRKVNRRSDVASLD